MQRSKLIDDLIDSVSGNSGPVGDVRVGLTWTVVNGRYCGMSKTYGISDKKSYTTQRIEKLIGREAAEVAEYAHSWDLVEASIGCAAILSMVPPRDGCIEINARDIILERSPGAKVVVVGAFPFIDKLREAAGELIVLELEPSLLNPEKNILPASACEYCIPDCDVLAITGSALINKSLEHLLDLARNSRTYTIILGPSTVMSDVLFDYGADVLAGSFVTNPEGLLRKIESGCEGTGKGIFPDEISFKVLTR